MKTFFIALLLLPTIMLAQNRLDKYEASNGITYKVKDTVRLGLGSGLQGTFVHLKMGGWMAGDATQIGSGYSNSAVVIKKIRKYKIKGVENVMFTVGGGNITNYNLMIEPAIQTCEVVPCSDSNKITVQTESDKYDKLAKLKKLFDDGVLTEAEYEVEKKKILDQNN